jgi:hypothetical protein
MEGSIVPVLKILLLLFISRLSFSFFIRWQLAMLIAAALIF